METQILKENLTKAIQTAVKFTTTRTQIPILANLLMEANEEGIFVAATNLEMGVKLRVAGKVIVPGKVVVPARILADLVQHLPLGGVRLRLGDGGLAVESGRFKARMQVGEVNDFPPFPVWEKRTGVLQVEAMNEAVMKVSFAVSNDEARPILTGILWRVEEGVLVATDGYRLSVVGGVKAWEAADKLEELLIPGRAWLQLLQTAASLAVKDCEFCYDEKAQQLLFRGQELMMSVRVLEGNYPQYEAILPKKSEVELVVSRDELLEAVQAAVVFARDSANIVKLAIEKEGLVVSANAAQVGENVVVVDGEVVRGGEITIAFNGKYLIDFLTHSEAERVGLGFSDPLKAGLFYEAGNPDYQHVIMPVRVREAE